LLKTHLKSDDNEINFKIKAVDMLLNVRYHKQPNLRDIKKELFARQSKFNQRKDHETKMEANNTLDALDKSRWARQISHSLINQKSIKNARVVVFGLGGIGSNVLLGLTYSGIHNFKIVDSDIIDLSNLNRQTLYEYDDLNCLKCEKAMDKLLKINPNLKIEALNLKIDYPEALNVFDLKEKQYPQVITKVNELIEWGDYIINAADFHGAPYLINDLCVKNRKPFFWAGVNHSLGEIYNYSPKNDCACLRCIFGPTLFYTNTPFLRYKTKENHPFQGVNIGSTVIVTGSLISELVIQDICEFPNNVHGHYLIFDAIDKEILKIKIKKQESCCCLNYPECE